LKVRGDEQSVTNSGKWFHAHHHREHRISTAQLTAEINMAPTCSEWHTVCWRAWQGMLVHSQDRQLTPPSVPCDKTSFQ